MHPSAVDQVEAHMALFDAKKNEGYGDLVMVLGDEIGAVLER